MSSSSVSDTNPSHSLPFHIFKQIVTEVGFEDPALRAVNQDYRQRFDYVLGQLWDELKTSPAPGPIDLTELITRTETDPVPGNNCYFTCFKKLEAEFAHNAAKIPDGKLPTTTAHYVELQNQTKRNRDEALVTVWPGILAKIPQAQQPQLNAASADEIRAWLNDPNNAVVLDTIAELGFSQLQLKILPEEVAKFSQLEKLFLSNNKIRFFPLSTLTLLINLKHLNLCCNEISFIPEEVIHLTKLEELWLNSNNIRSIPMNISALKHLKVLGLNDNKIGSIPLSICALTKLEKLGLSRNGIRFIPKEIESLRQLNELALDGNQIRFIPVFMLEMEEIKFLHIKENIITSLNTNCSNFKELKNQDKTKTYKAEAERPSSSNLAQLYQWILCGKSKEAIAAVLSKLAPEDRSEIYRRVWTLAGSPTGDPEWGEHHAFENLDHFYHAVRETILDKFKKLPEKNKDLVYSEVAWLARDPKTRDSQWGKAHAFDNLPLLADAMDSLNDKQDLMYNAHSCLAKLYQLIACEKPKDEIEAILRELAPEDRNGVYRRVWTLAGSPKGDPEWGEHHAFENLNRFYHAVRKTILDKFEELPQEEKNLVYGQVYRLAGHPPTQDPRWGETHVLDNLPLLADAINSLPPSEAALKDLWAMLIRCRPPGPINLKELMPIIGVKVGSAAKERPYLACFKGLQAHFADAGAKIPDWRFPTTFADYEDLQNQVAENRALVTIWPRIIEKIPEGHACPIPQSPLAEICAWLNNPNNKSIVLSITKLDFSQLELEMLPQEILKFSNLQDLNLSDNKLTSIPKCVCALTKLEYLNLSFNKISSIKIRGLTKLYQAIFYGNPISFIPSYILDMPQSFALFFGRNSIPFIEENNIKCITFQNIENEPDIINYKKEITYNSSSPLARLYQSIICDKPNGEILAIVRDLMMGDKTRIFQKLESLAEPKEEHALEHLGNFYLAVRETILDNLQGLSQEEKNWVYGEVYRLAGHPQTQDARWGETHALDNLPLLADALASSRLNKIQNI